MAFTLPSLPYSFDALEPHIDARTMEIHHDRHHATYVTNLNGAIAKHPELADESIEALLSDLDSVPEDIRTVVRNSGGGHLNHSIFWETMTAGGGGDPTGDIADAINGAFGDFATFKDTLSKAAIGQFGSGWGWAYLSGGKLTVKGFPNQDNPISSGGVPIIGVDVWEHAYYLNYQNRRPDYLDAFWNVVDWDGVAQRFAA